MKTKCNRIFIALALLALAILNRHFSTAIAQGALTPPGAPAPTMKTLTQIEPRTDVLTLPGNGNNQYLITQSGSYYLTTNIVGVASKNGINIQADSVTLDLNGFTLFGGVTNSQVGITVTGLHVGLVIRNGTVSGWVGNGITAGSAMDSEFEHLRFITNGSAGMKLGSGNKVANCIIIGNGGDGLDTGSNCTVTACTVNGNNSGISAGANCSILECQFNNNPNYGILTGDNCQIAKSVFVANGDAIVVGQDGSIISCTAVNNYFGGILTGNGCCLKDTITLTNGVDDFFDSWGVSTGNGCTIIGCTANGNYGEGIEAGNGCTIKDCTADMNQAGGFFVDADCTVTGCTAWTNNFNGFVLGSECSIINCNACANNGSGIVAGYSCLVKDNTTASNDRYVPNNGGAAGIYASYSGCRIEGNNSNSDYYGIWVNGSENIVINNTVRAALNLNYFIVGGNMTGTVVNVAPETSGIDGSSGGIGMGTTDPFANFSF